MGHTTALLIFFIAVSLSVAQPQTITDVIDSDPNFSILSSLLKATGNSYTLSQPGPFTLFAPNNTAFKALPSATLKYLTDSANAKVLSSILQYHVIAGQALSYFQLTLQLQNHTLTTALGSTITVNARSAYKSANQLAISINNARVIQANIQASNGIIYSLDRVLVTDLWELTSTYSNLFGLISSNPNLSTLTYALKATGLDSVLTLYTPGNQYTVFAPTNDAFTDPSLAGLFNVYNRDALKNVLLYHVLGLPVYSTDLYDGLQAPTAFNNEVVTVSRTALVGSTTTINDATVLSADSTAYNGVMHTIDRVLLPYAL